MSVILNWKMKKTAMEANVDMTLQYKPCAGYSFLLPLNYYY